MSDFGYGFGDEYYDDQYEMARSAISQYSRNESPPIFKNEQDKNLYILMLAGFIKPEVKKTSRDLYDEMLMKKRGRRDDF